MKTEIGIDGRWCASGKGYMRAIVTFASSRKEAKKLWAEVFQAQKSEEYHFCESMSHLTDVNEPNWTPHVGYQYES